MKKIFYFLLACIVVSCGNDEKREKEKDYTILSGKISNPVDDKISISGYDFNKEIMLKGDGSFTDTLNIEEKGFYTLGHGREYATLYLADGNELSFSLDTKQFDESLAFDGDGAEENDYLAQKTLANEAMRSNSVEFYSLEEPEFLKKVDSVEKAHLKNLESNDKIDGDFLATEKKNLVYDSYGLLNSYENSHAYYTKKEGFKTSEDFLPKELRELRYDNVEDYKNSRAYQQMAFNRVMDDIFDNLGDDYQTASAEDLKAVKDIKIEALKDDVISYLGNFLVSPVNPNMKELHTFFVSNTNDEEIKTKIDEKYEKVKGLTKGNPSPQFAKYENHEGGTTSLSDLKGKYVYVDVWATWCGPCIREIPSLKKVEHDYAGKNIAFVSTSIDEAAQHDAWVKMVNDKDLGGIQLMADNNWNSKFVKDYAIEGIPRFILIDPDGNIVSADAPRPSNPKLVEMFESLKI